MPVEFHTLPGNAGHFASLNGQSVSMPNLSERAKRAARAELTRMAPSAACERQRQNLSKMGR